MGSLKSQIEAILHKTSIIDYLEKRGHVPVNEIGSGRYRFLCPFDDHNEKVPSFVVFTQAPYENFYCFGCQRSRNIIHLVSYLDHSSFKEALEKLSEGVVVSPEEDIKYTLERIKRDIDGSKEGISDFSRTLLEMSSQCLLYSQGVDFDEDEMEIIDRYYVFMDEQINVTQFDKIEESAKCLPSVLIKRKHIFDKKKEKKKHEQGETL